MFHRVAENSLIQEAPIVLNVAAGVELVHKSVLKIIEDLQETPLAHIAIADAHRKQGTHRHLTLGSHDQFRRGPIGGFTVQARSGERINGVGAVTQRRAVADIDEVAQGVGSVVNQVADAGVLSHCGRKTVERVGDLAQGRHQARVIAPDDHRHPRHESSGFQSLLYWISHCGRDRSPCTRTGYRFNPCCIGLAIAGPGVADSSRGLSGFQSLLYWISHCGDDHPVPEESRHEVSILVVLD